MNLGAETGGTVACPSCRGTVRNKEFVCSVHDRCVPATTYATCADYTVYPEIATRHLLYHVYPVRGNGAWQRNVALLLPHLSQFNGKRVVAVATDDSTDSPEAVRAAFDPEAVDVLSFPNAPALREVATFRPLFDAVKTTDPTHAVAYAHAKGVTAGRARDPQVARWTEALYRATFGCPDRLAAALRTHPVAGAFLKTGRGWPAHESLSAWHYSGSFFWFRAAELFRRADWMRIDNFWAGIEPYLSLHFPLTRAAHLVHRASVAAMNLYSADVWRAVIEPKLAGLS